MWQKHQCLSVEPFEPPSLLDDERMHRCWRLGLGSRLIIVQDCCLLLNQSRGEVPVLSIHAFHVQELLSHVLLDYVFDQSGVEQSHRPRNGSHTSEQRLGSPTRVERIPIRYLHLQGKVGDHVADPDLPHHPAAPLARFLVVPRRSPAHALQRDAVDDGVRVAVEDVLSAQTGETEGSVLGLSPAAVGL